jgi:hypothetical protein
MAMRSERGLASVGYASGIRPDSVPTNMRPLRREGGGLSAPRTPAVPGSPPENILEKKKAAWSAGGRGFAGMAVRAGGVRAKGLPDVRVLWRRPA